MSCRLVFDREGKIIGVNSASGKVIGSTVVRPDNAPAIYTRDLTRGLVEYLNQYTTNSVTILDSQQINENLGKVREPNSAIIGEQGVTRLDSDVRFRNRLFNLEVAKKMETSNLKPADIFRATGWEKGVDGEWRYEILDGDVNFNFKGTNAKDVNFENEVFETTLEDIYDNSELYKAYPKLKGVNVIFYTGETSFLDSLNMFYFNELNNIYINRDIYEDKENRPNKNKPTIQKGTRLKSDLIHEVQHAIQRLEGFPRGGNPTLSRKEVGRAVEGYKKQGISYFSRDTNTQKFQEIFESVDKNWETILKNENNKEAYSNFIENATFKNYLRVAGEVEARNVQNRLNLTKEERQNTPLEFTEDTARDSQSLNAIDFSIIGEVGIKNLDRLEESTIRRDKLILADKMEQEGLTKDVIRMATNWERGTDGKWRYEILDGQFVDTLPDKKNLTIVDIYKNEELFKAYPNLKDVKVRVENNPNSRERMGYIPNSKTITINKAHYELREGTQSSGESGKGRELSKLRLGLNFKRFFLHEVQHYVQEMEGFSGGGNTLISRREILRTIRRIQSKDGRLTNDEKNNVELLREINPSYEEILKGKFGEDLEFDLIQRAIYAHYHRTAGEVEARNVSERIDLTEQERKERLLETTEDVSRDKQVQIFETTEGKVYGYHNSATGEIVLNSEYLNQGTLLHELDHFNSTLINRAAEKGDVVAKSVLKKRESIIEESGFDKEQAIAFYKEAGRVANNTIDQQFISERNKLTDADKESLTKAKKLKEQGKENTEIYTETKWFESKGKWLREVSDIEIPNQQIEKAFKEGYSDFYVESEYINKPILVKLEVNESKTKGEVQAEVSTAILEGGKEGYLIEIESGKKGMFGSDYRPSYVPVSRTSREETKRSTGSYSKIQARFNHEIQHIYQKESGRKVGNNPTDIVKQYERHHSSEYIEAYPNKEISIYQFLNELYNVEDFERDVAYPRYRKSVGENQSFEVERRYLEGRKDTVPTLLEDAFDIDVDTTDNLQLQTDGLYLPREGESQSEYVERMKSEFFARLMENARINPETIDKSLLQKLTEWVKEFYNWVTGQKGITNLHPEQIQNLDIQEFIDKLAVSYLRDDFSGTEQQAENTQIVSITNLTDKQIEQYEQGIKEGTVKLDRYTQEEFEMGYIRGFGENASGIGLVVGRNLGENRSEQGERNQTTALLDYAKKVGIYQKYSDFKEQYGDRHEHGVESDVWFLPKEDKVVKLMTPLNTMEDNRIMTPQEFIDRVVIHNYYSPETALTFKGIVGEGNNFKYLVEQKYIYYNSSDTLTNEERSQAMGDRYGAELMNIYDNDFLVDDTIFADLHAKNLVRGVDGNIYMIDPVTMYNTEEMGYGGSWRGLNFITKLNKKEDGGNIQGANVANQIPQGEQRSTIQGGEILSEGISNSGTSRQATRDAQLSEDNTTRDRGISESLNRPEEFGGVTKGASVESKPIYEKSQTFEVLKSIPALEQEDLEFGILNLVGEELENNTDVEKYENGDVKVFFKGKDQVFETYAEAVKTKADGVEMGYVEKGEFKNIFTLDNYPSSFSKRGFIVDLTQRGLLSGVQTDNKLEATGETETAKIVNANAVVEIAKANPYVTEVRRDDDGGITLEMETEEENKLIDTKGEEQIVTDADIRNSVKEGTYDSLLEKYPNLPEIVLKLFLKTSKYINGFFTKVQGESQTLSEEDAKQKLLQILSNLGFNTVGIADYIANYNERKGLDVTADALVDIAKKVVAFAEGKQNLDNVSEEVAHVLIEAYENQDLINELEVLVTETEQWQKYQEQYREKYAKLYEDSAKVEKMVRREVLGKILKDKIQDRFKSTPANKTLVDKLQKVYSDVVSTIRRFLNIQQAADLQKELDSIADSVLNGKIYETLDTSNLENNDALYYSLSDKRAYVVFNNYREKLERRLQAIDKKETYERSIISGAVEQLKQDIATLSNEYIINDQWSAAHTIMSTAKYMVKESLRKVGDASRGEYKMTPRDYIGISNLLEQHRTVLSEIRNEIHTKFTEEHQGYTKSKLIRDFDEVLKDLSNLDGVKETAHNSVIDNLQEELTHQFNFNAEQASTYESLNKGVLKDANLLFSNFGSLQHASNNLLGQLEVLLSRVRSKSITQTLKVATPFLNKVQEGGFNLERFKTLLEVNEKGEFTGNLVGEYNLDKRDKELTDLEVNTYNEVYGIKLSSKEYLLRKRKATLHDDTVTAIVLVDEKGRELKNEDGKSELSIDDFRKIYGKGSNIHLQSGGFNVEAGQTIVIKTSKGDISYKIKKAVSNKEKVEEFYTILNERTEQYHLNGNTNRRYKASFYRNRRKVMSYLNISKLTQSKLGNLSKRRSAINSKYMNKNGRVDEANKSEYDRRRTQEIYLEGRDLRSFTNIDGTRKTGEDLKVAEELKKLDAYYRLINSDSNVALEARVEAFNKEHNTELSLEFVNLNKQSFKVSDEFLDTIKEVEQMKGKVAAFKWASTNGGFRFTTKFWEELKSNNMSFKDKLDKVIEEADSSTNEGKILRDAAEKLKEDIDKKYEILKMYQKANNPSEIEYELMGEAEQVIRELEESIASNLTRLNETLYEMEESQVELPNVAVENTVNEAYTKALADSKIPEIDFLKKHLTTNNKAKVDKLIFVLNKIKKTEEPRITKDIYRIMSDIMGVTYEDITVDKIKKYLQNTTVEQVAVTYGKTKVLPYFKRFAPKGYTEFLNNFKNGKHSVVDFMNGNLYGMDGYVEMSPSYFWTDSNQQNHLNPSYNPNYEGGSLQPSDKFLNEEFFDRFGIDKNAWVANGRKLKEGMATKNVEDYNMLLDLYELKRTMLKNYGEEQGSIYKIPQFGKKTTQTMQDILKDPKTNIVNKVRDIIYTRRDTQELGAMIGNKSYREISNMRDIPKYGLMELEETSDLSLELASTYMMGLQQSLLYKERQATLDKVVALESQFRNLNYERGVDPYETNHYRMFKEFVDAHIFGIKRNNPVYVTIQGRRVDVSKMVGIMEKVVRYANVAFSYAVAGAGYLTGNSFALTEAMAGEYFDRSSLLAGNKEMLKLTPDFVSDLGVLNKKSKLYLLSEFYGVNSLSERTAASGYTRGVRLLNNIGYRIHQMFDHPVSNKTMLAVLKDYKVVEKDNGEVVIATHRDLKAGNMPKHSIKGDLYDYIEVTEQGVQYNQKLQDLFKDREDVLEDYHALVMSKVNRAVSNVVSVLYEGDIPSASRHTFKNLLTSHKGWLFIGMQRRFKRSHFNHATGEFEEGHYRSIANTLTTKDGRRVIWELLSNPSQLKDIMYNSELTETQVRNFNRVGFESVLYVLLTMLGMTIAGMDDDDDDDNLAFSVLSYLTYRWASEVGSTQLATKFGGVTSMAERPIMLAGKINKLLNPDISKWGEEIKGTSVYQGYTKGEKYIIEWTPFKQYLDFKNSDLRGDQFRKQNTTTLWFMQKQAKKDQ